MRSGDSAQICLSHAPFPEGVIPIDTKFGGNHNSMLTLRRWGLLKKIVFVLPIFCIDIHVHVSLLGYIIG